MTAGLTALIASACGLVAANIYYGQPLAGPIGAALGLTPAATGLVVTLTQIGYGLGLLLIVPLADLVENRRLVVALILVAAAALVSAGLSQHAAPFLASALVIGLGSVAVQVLVPYAAHLAPEASRGRVVGNVMSGLMLGIMMARPVSSFVAGHTSWHVMFFLSAAAMVGLAGVLWLRLPQRRPAARLGYGALLASMGRLVRDSAVLRRRALYQASLFGAFSLFWTVTPLLLAERYGLSQQAIALFALAGVAGAVASPVAGTLADRGWSRPGTVLALAGAVLAFAITHLAEPGSAAALALLTVAAILLDACVTTNLVIGQRAIYSIGAAERARLNGLFMATFFAGGAIGSAVGAFAYARGGWTAASLIGGALPLLGLLFFATEPRALLSGARTAPQSR
jgi:predicted MFS family arabinose efflux permease